MDFQELWDATEILYDKFRESRDALDVDDHPPVYSAILMDCLDSLEDVEGYLEVLGAIPHSIHVGRDGRRIK